MRRVVVTGIGVVSPLGCDIRQVWGRILQGDSAVGAISRHNDPEKTPGVLMMAEVSRTDGFKDLFTSRGIRYQSSATSEFIDFAMLASDLALEHAGNPLQCDPIPAERRGVAIGSGMGSLAGIVSSSKQFDESFKKLSPFFIPKVLINLAAGQVSIRHSMKGPNHAVATACAAGAMSVGDAYNFMRLDYADMMLCGGVECSSDPLTRAGFSRIKALSPSNDPLTASRPFDRGRDGFVIGEGAAVLVLETLDSVLERNREGHVLAEVCGYGVSGDASHITAPPSDGEGGRRAMMSALRDAGNLAPQRVGYINAHATSTPLGDAAELRAIDAIFGPSAGMRSPDEPLYVSSTKGATGHMLGAAGAIEAAFAVMAVNSGCVPPTTHLKDPDILLESFRHVMGSHVNTPQLQYSMSNSFGFGGVNASLIFKKYIKS